MAEQSRGDRIYELEAEVKRLREAGLTLANIAAQAVAEPRRFHGNESGRQQILGRRVAEFRRVAALYPHETEDET